MHIQEESRLSGNNLLRQRPRNNTVILIPKGTFKVKMKIPAHLRFCNLMLFKNVHGKNIGVKVNFLYFVSNDLEQGGISIRCKALTTEVL